MRRFLTDVVVITTVAVVVMVVALVYTYPMRQAKVDLPDSKLDLSTVYPLCRPCVPGADGCGDLDPADFMGR